MIMVDENDLTGAQNDVIEYLRSNKKATFEQIESEVEFGTEAAEELLKNLRHKEIIRRTKEDRVVGSFTVDVEYYMLRDDFQE